MADFKLRNRFKPHYDVVVIGAGMGGLSAGIHAALAGKDVLVLEQHNLPGGFATSFVRGRYEFEATLHELLDFDTPERMGPIRKLLNDAGVECELSRVPEPYVIVVPNEGINVRLPFGIENFIEAIEEEVPGSKEEVTRYMELCNNVYRGILYIRECAEKGQKPDPKVLKTKYKGFIENIHKTAAEVEEEFDLPPKVKSLIRPYWCYQGVPLSELTFTTWSYMICGYLTTGAYVPKDRSHALSVALTERIRELGGQVEFNCKVEKIHVENRKVKAVELADGTYIETDIVLSNAHPHVVYGKMIEPKSEISEFEIKKINAQVPSCSAVTVYLGLDENPKDIGIEHYEYFIGETTDTDEIYNSFYRFEPPKWVSAICHENGADATEEGICQLSITGLMMGDAWKDVTPETYFEEKDRFADHLVKMFEDALDVNLRDHIEEIEMVTPETWARYTGAYKGQVFGYEQQPWNSSLVRKIVEEEEKKYAIKGLDFVGGCSTNGHAYSCSLSSGREVTLKMLKEMEGSK